MRRAWSRSRAGPTAAEKLFDVHAATGPAIAKEALERIAGLFKIEAEINGHGPEQRHAVRHERAFPQLLELKEFLDEALDRISRKSGLPAAIRYGLSRWQALCRFAHDGRPAGDPLGVRPRQALAARHPPRRRLAKASPFLSRRVCFPLQPPHRQKRQPPLRPRHRARRANPAYHLPYTGDHLTLVDSQFIEFSQPDCPTTSQGSYL
jgi:hypothetical protein